MTTLADYLGADKDKGQREAHLVQAWKAFENGAARREDARIIIEYIERLTAAGTSPCLVDYMKSMQTAQGYDFYMAEHQARTRVWLQLMQLRKLAERRA